MCFIYFRIILLFCINICQLFKIYDLIKVNYFLVSYLFTHVYLFTV